MEVAGRRSYPFADHVRKGNDVVFTIFFHLFDPGHVESAFFRTSFTLPPGPAQLLMTSQAETSIWSHFRKRFSASQTSAILLRVYRGIMTAPLIFLSER